MIVYIAGPYSKGDQAQNVRNAIDVAERLLAHGLTPFIPHLTHFWHLVYHHDWETWLKIDSEILRRCDCVLRIPGESAGADREVELASQLGIPIFYSIQELCASL